MNQIFSSRLADLQSAMPFHGIVQRTAKIINMDRVFPIVFLLVCFQHITQDDYFKPSSEVSMPKSFKKILNSSPTISLF